MDLPGSQSISGISQDPPCAHASLTKRSLPHMPTGRASLDITPLGPLRKLSMHMWSGRPLDFENEKYVAWAGPSLLPLIVLLFSSGVFGPQRMNLLSLHCVGGAGRGKYLPLTQYYNIQMCQINILYTSYLCNVSCQCVPASVRKGIGDEYNLWGKL